MVTWSCDFFRDYTSVLSQDLINVTCIGEVTIVKLFTSLLNCVLLCNSTKSDKCLSCDQSSWGLPTKDHCDYFTASYDVDVELCLLYCQGVAMT